MKKIAFTVALAGVLCFSVPAQAHAELATIGSFIFQGLYSLGLPGAIANTIANLAIPALAIGAALGGMRKGGDK